MTTPASRWRRVVPAALYMALLFAHSSIPDTGAPEGLERWALAPSPALQNLLHVPAYAVLAWLWTRALRTPGRSLRRAALLAAAVAAGFGALDEYHQTFVRGRTGSGTDVALDVLGALAVLAAAWWWTGRRAVPGTPPRGA